MVAEDTLDQYVLDPRRANYTPQPLLPYLCSSGHNDLKAEHLKRDSMEWGLRAWNPESTV